LTEHDRGERLLSDSKIGLKDDNLFKFTWKLVSSFDLNTFEIKNVNICLGMPFIINIIFIGTSHI
jgi:hypothetical protein